MRTTPAVETGSAEIRTPMTLDSLLRDLEREPSPGIRRIIGETIYHLGGRDAVQEVSQQMVQS